MQARVPRAGDGYLRQVTPKAIQQVDVVRAAATDQQPTRIGCMPLDRCQDRAGGQLGQRCLHVIRRNTRGQCGKVLLEPAKVEVFEARAFRGRQAEKFVGQQLLEQRGMYAPGCRPGAVSIECLPGAGLGPAVQQSVAGAGVEAQRHVAGRIQDRQVGDTPQVEHDARIRSLAEKPGMERRHQRRALAARRDVGTAKIGDRGYTGTECDRGRVADLQRKGRFAERLMPDGLSVAADRGDVARAHAGGVDDGEGGVAKLLADASVECAEAIDRAGIGIVNESPQLLPERRRVGPLQARMHPHLAVAETDDDRVDAVHAGAGHQPDVTVAHVGSGVAEGD